MWDVVVFIFTFYAHLRFKILTVLLKYFLPCISNPVAQKSHEKIRYGNSTNCSLRAAFRVTITTEFLIIL